MDKEPTNKRPDWCINSDCLFDIQSQDKMCIGKLPKPEPHDNDFNTHRLCIDTRETGHGIFDLQINWTDCWGLIRLLNRVKDNK
jgi:hypothetical protein